MHTGFCESELVRKECLQACIQSLSWEQRHQDGWACHRWNSSEGCVGESVVSRIGRGGGAMAGRVCKRRAQQLMRENKMPQTGSGAHLAISVLGRRCEVRAYATFVLLVWSTSAFAKDRQCKNRWKGTFGNTSHQGRTAGRKLQT